MGKKLAYCCAYVDSLYTCSWRVLSMTVLLEGVHMTRSDSGTKPWWWG